MRVVIQRVETATVEVVGEPDATRSIGPGWLALVGVFAGDDSADADALADRVAGLRAFPDSEGKMNLSVLDTGGAVLAVSNFTLAADCSKGRRPGFNPAAPPAQALPLFDRFVESLRKAGVPAVTGRFGAEMRVSLINAGPATFVLDSGQKSTGHAHGGA